MSLLKSRVVAVVAAASVIGVASTTGAVAAKMITGDDIKNGTVESKDIANDTIRGKDVKNGSLGFGDLNETAKSKISDQAGVALAGSLATDATVITNLGGSFATRATELGTVELPEAGTYVINGYGFFDSLEDVPADQAGSQLQLALRTVPAEGEQWGEDFGTCFTGAVPVGDREMTCQSVRTVTVDAPTSVIVWGFGYNADQGSDGSGNFTVTADVSALKVG
ncbi:hypothetical protein ncot_15290 [Nocardioides sp. JQ2195]|uniref:hypothetical protein n=1 Tax=Nocardioides sp. JQ2195 TaxID=2592334 RepID=UPI00143ECDBB|nr:hypothetical protein [Nocardioides sp. JQ2195]QIX27804.1 hypothetical protein ncot_15290 [Nocardioides sp. JQ2195]